MSLLWCLSQTPDIGDSTSPLSMAVTAALLMVCASEVLAFVNLVQSFVVTSVTASSEGSDLAVEVRRTRVVQHFLFICAVAKFYHLVLVALAWFVILPALDQHRPSQIGLLSLSIQNIVAIYGLTLLGLAPYAKYLYVTNLEQIASLWSFSHLSKNYQFFESSVVGLFAAISYACF